MKHNLIKKSLAWAMVPALTVMFFGASPVLAASPDASVTISPPIFDLTMNAGETQTKTLEIMNGGGSTMAYSVSVNGMTAGNETGGAAFTPVSDNDLSGWITVSPDTLILDPDKSGKITLTIKIPKNAAPGGHYATVFTTSEPGKIEGGSGIGTAQMVGAHVLVKVTGNVILSASVAEFSTPHARFAQGESVDFTVRVKNDGNVHLKPQGVIEILRNGVKVDEVQVNPGQGNVLPNSIRRFDVKSTKSLTPGRYTANLVLMYEGNTINVPALSFVVVGESSLALMAAIGLGVLVLVLAAALLVNRKKQPVVPPVRR
jgi:uncharacterized membrane protein